MRLVHKVRLDYEQHDIADAAVMAEWLARVARAGGVFRAARGKRPPRVFRWLRWVAGGKA